MMKLTSVFENGASIPQKYTCDGANISPPFYIFGVPHDAQSLVLILEDIDVPHYISATGIWDHWVIFDIPPNTTHIEEGHEPPGTPGVGTGGNNKYYGPCPPDGEHRYYFRLYALDSVLQLRENPTKQLVLEAMKDHILAETELMGVYGRS